MRYTVGGLNSYKVWTAHIAKRATYAPPRGPATTRLELTVVQLEEAKRFIQADRVPYLRLALILLDNAAEVLIHRKIQDEIQHSEMYAGMAATLRSFPRDDEEKRNLLSRFEREIIPRKGQRALRRYFSKKSASSARKGHTFFSRLLAS